PRALPRGGARARGAGRDVLRAARARRFGRAGAHGPRLLGGSLHRRGAQHHRLLEIRLLRGWRRPGRVAGEHAAILAQLDDVVVLQEVLLDRIAVDQRAVGAAQVLEEAVVQDGDDDGVLAAHREVVDLDVVVRLAADGGALLAQGDLLEHQPVHAEYQFRHSRPLEPILTIPRTSPLRLGRRGTPAGRARV